MWLTIKAIIRASFWLFKQIFKNLVWLFGLILEETFGNSNTCKLWGLAMNVSKKLKKLDNVQY
jgi:hypothetical protein